MTPRHPSVPNLILKVIFSPRLYDDFGIISE
jgi:hypothetical protein